MFVTTILCSEILIPPTRPGRRHKPRDSRDENRFCISCWSSRNIQLATVWLLRRSNSMFLGENNVPDSYADTDGKYQTDHVITWHNGNNIRVPPCCLERSMLPTSQLKDSTCPLDHVTSLFLAPMALDTHTHTPLQQKHAK